jgi:hypothetical protein
VRDRDSAKEGERGVSEGGLLTVSSRASRAGICGEHNDVDQDESTFEILELILQESKGRVFEI